MSMYKVPTNGCNLEIMGYPFFAEKVSANEAFRRRDMNVNQVVGGTQIVTKGPYVPLEFTITTHVYVAPSKPHVHSKIFQEMMSKPVLVSSPEIGGKFYAMVVIKPEHVKVRSLELSITIKEIPGKQSKIPGESFTIPKAKKVEVKQKSDKGKGKGKGKSTDKNSKGKTTQKVIDKGITAKITNLLTKESKTIKKNSKRKTSTKKNKSKK